MKKVFGIIILFIAAYSLFAVGSNNNDNVKGIWLTVSGTQAPYSKEGIRDAVKKCKELGMNSIYFAVWNQSMTNFQPSEKFLEKYPFIKMNPNFKLDPLGELIKEAHANKIRVIAWFEYGSVTSYNNPTGGPILEAKPEWKAIDNEGKLVTKNKFQWMNAFNPDVQKFMLDLIMNVVNNYNVDGIQGDDRMPALPVTAGYDAYTENKYKTEHAGQEPPKDYNDADWIQWRCEILNKFMEEIHNMIVKFNAEHNKNIQIEMAPSVYPWAKANYLQDWPTWLKKGWIDKVFPQIYRYSIDFYETTLKENLSYVEEKDFNKFYPGVLIGVGGKIAANKAILQQMIEMNRALGLKGEVFFYYESLTDSDVFNIIKTEYSKQNNIGINNYINLET